MKKLYNKILTELSVLCLKKTSASKNLKEDMRDIIREIRYVQRMLGVRK